MAKVIAFLVLLVITPAAFAVDYTVGNSSGWTTGVNYTAWAMGRTFTTADALVFNYGPSHAVDIVANADDYDDCDTDRPRSTYRSSPTRIPLNVTGPWYFICPTPNHCEAGGQRLAINVTAGGSISPGGAPPPSSGSVPPTPSVATPPGMPPSMATPPPPSAAAGLEVGLISIVMAAVVGLLG